MHEYTVALRIVGETLRTEEISQKLGITPTHVVEVGQPLKTAVATKAVWTLEVGPPDGSKEWKSLEEAFSRCLLGSLGAKR